MVWHNRRQFVIWNYLNQWWPSLLTHICVTRSRENVDIVLLDFAFLSLHHHIYTALHWRHNESDSVSNHQRLDCLLNRLFRRRSKKISKLHVPGLCEWKPQMTGGFPPQRASNAENSSIWWRHHGFVTYLPLYNYDVKQGIILRVTGFCENPPVTGGFPSHRAGDADFDVCLMLNK